MVRVRGLRDGIVRPILPPTLQCCCAILTVGCSFNWATVAPLTPNDQRSHAGRRAVDCNRDALPALAAASGWPT